MRTVLLTTIGVAVLIAAVTAQQKWEEGVGSGARVSDDRFGRATTEWTPVAPKDIASGPAPRLHDGKPDLSGPWVGGGSNGNIGRDGGMKEELPLLPWAKALRDSRKEEDEPYLYCTPMGVPRANPYLWRVVQCYASNGPSD